MYNIAIINAPCFLGLEVEIGFLGIYFLGRGAGVVLFGLDFLGYGTGLEQGLGAVGVANILSRCCLGIFLKPSAFLNLARIINSSLFRFSKFVLILSI